MRYVVLTDIHANLEALDACLADAGTRCDRCSCSAIRRIRRGSERA